MTKSKDMVPILGQMGEDMMEIGVMEDSMAKESIFCQMEARRSGFGRKERGSNG